MGDGDGMVINPDMAPQYLPRCMQRTCEEPSTPVVSIAQSAANSSSEQFVLSDIAAGYLDIGTAESGSCDGAVTPASANEREALKNRASTQPRWIRPCPRHHLQKPLIGTERTS